MLAAFLVTLVDDTSFCLFLIDDVFCFSDGWVSDFATPFSWGVFVPARSLSIPLVIVFFIESVLFKSPLVWAFDLMDADLLTVGRFGSFSIILRGGGQTAGFLDFSLLSESVEDSLSLLLGEGDRSVSFLGTVVERFRSGGAGEGLLDLRSIGSPIYLIQDFVGAKYPPFAVLAVVFGGSRFANPFSLFSPFLFLSKSISSFFIVFSLTFEFCLFKLPDLPELSEDLLVDLIFVSSLSNPFTDEPFLDGDFPAGDILLPLTTDGLLV